MAEPAASNSDAQDRLSPDHHLRGLRGAIELLEALYKRGLSQPEVGTDLRAGDGLLMFWSHSPIAPWQTPEWIEQMRSTLRPHAFLRMIENRFTSSEEHFVDMAWWDACTITRPVVPTPTYQCGSASMPA